MVIVLTRQGRDLWRKVAPRYDAGVREIFSALPRPRRKPFLDGLETLYAALKRDSGDTSPATLRDILRPVEA